ncbi:ribosomal RNA processing protein 1 homolog A [Orycteropus afer afer]|uniref:Ribosomal RNA processing protein 1 homolog A n=1 Tax=Orycteropus afer afer TaxID=1230840 RepID=A0AC54Z8D6_ORYAF|nr:ribosomal RNA processing protein 1 homolog A [Orycteropus afer afer]
MVSRVQLPPEIQLAQRLAGNEKVTRDRAVKKLRKYIVARTQRAEGGFTHDELLKVWKGLFYCMWMQDKPLLQEELGRTISQLIHAFQSTEAQHLFLQTFWQTMNREWTGIDRLRLDKFYLLMRMVLNESLKALQMRDWEESQSEQLLKLLMTEILHPDSQAPHGVKSHFTEIFLEELAKVGAKELTADQNLRFIDPFCQIAARTTDPRDLHNIARGIFETIVEQAPFAIEDLMNELDEEEEGDDKEEELSEEDDLEENDLEEMEEEEKKDELDVPTVKPAEMQLKGSIHKPQPKPGVELAEDDGDGAGAVLQFDYEAVANRLFEMASEPNTPSLNRKRLYKLIRKLQDLSAGIFPEDDVPEKVYAYQHEGRLQRKMKKCLLKSQLQKKKGKGRKEDLSPAPRSRSEGRKRKRKGKRTDPDVQPEGGMPRDQSRGRGRPGARSRRRGKPGARAKVVGGAEFQESKKKKKRIQENKE